MRVPKGCAFFVYVSVNLKILLDFQINLKKDFTFAGIIITAQKLDNEKQT